MRWKNGRTGAISPENQPGGRAPSGSATPLDTAWYKARTRSDCVMMPTSRCWALMIGMWWWPASENSDGENYFVRDGIVIIPKNGVVPDGAVI